MEYVDISYVNGRLHKRGQINSKSHKNLFSDLLHELSVAIGFDIGLLHEDGVKTKRFLFIESDIDDLKILEERMLSKEGKRLRCNDYEGAGAEFVWEMMYRLLTLAEHAGVEKGDLDGQYLRMMIRTDFIIIREVIRMDTDELETDIDERFFIEEGDLEGNDVLEDDNMNGTAKFAFLKFIVAHYPRFGIEDIRGIYWFYKLEMHELYHNEFMEEVDYIKSLTDEEREQFAQYALERIHYDDVVSQDDERNDMLEEFMRIEKGGGKLQDIKKQKNRFISILDKDEEKAKEILKTPMPKPDNMPSKKKVDIVSDYMEKEILLEKAARNYFSFKKYRRNHPVEDKDKTILELDFEKRFGVDMVDEGGE